MSRRAKVTLTVSVGVFMASLDLFIVNIAFPDIQRDFSVDQPELAVVGAERVCDHVRGAAGSGRTVG